MPFLSFPPPVYRNKQVKVHEPGTNYIGPFNINIKDVSSVILDHGTKYGCYLCTATRLIDTPIAISSHWGE